LFALGEDLAPNIPFPISHGAIRIHDAAGAAVTIAATDRVYCLTCKRCADSFVVCVHGLRGKVQRSRQHTRAAGLVSCAERLPLRMRQFAVFGAQSTVDRCGSDDFLDDEIGEEEKLAFGVVGSYDSRSLANWVSFEL
jgi:hypothetical protein